MEAKKIKLKADGLLQNCFIACRELDIEFNQKSIEYDTLPGSDESELNDGWACFIPGERSWSSSFSGLMAYDEEMFHILVKEHPESLEASALISLDDNYAISGNVILSSANMSARAKGICTISANIEGQDFPTIKSIEQ